MSKIVSIDDQVIQSQGRSTDPRLIIGTGHYFETIDELLLATDILKEGLLSTDVDNSVTWQIYLDGATWKARLYDGVFFVDVLCMDPTPGESHSGHYFYGNITEDGVVMTTGQTILVVNAALPHMNGLWVINTSSHWTRHPLFDGTIDDNIVGLIFRITSGTTYRNSQWVFTTLGTPNISSDPVDFSDPAITSLDFEKIGSEKAFVKTTLTSSGAITRFQKVTLLDATSALLQFNFAGQVFLDYKYEALKIDSSTNPTEFLGFGGDYVYHVLLEQGDFAHIISHTGDNTDFTITSNRINKILTPATRTTNGKLSLDIPKGYRLYSITSTMADNTEASYIDYGTASGLSDLDASVALIEDTPYTKVLNRSDVKEIWVKESIPYEEGVTESSWYGGTLTVTMLIVQESENLSRLTTVNAATYNILPTDELVHVTYTSTGAVTNLQLMTNLLSINHVITIKDAGGNAAVNNITITTEGVETIDGAATYVMNSNYQAIEIYTDGSNFFIK